jgi:hypothetical protein
MPLLDHFTEPVNPRARWAPFHSFWAPAIARGLNRTLPERFFASVNVHLGNQVSADVAEADYGPPAGSNGSGGGLALETVALPAATGKWPWRLPDEVELPIVDTDADRLVAVIELVSPSNKDRPQTRRSFAGKCAAYLDKGIGVIIVDVVMKHHFNLHNELVGLLDLADSFAMAGQPHLYATSYRPEVSEGAAGVEYWAVPLQLGDRLPVLPFSLKGWGTVSLDFEESYADTCHECRLA